MTSDELIKLIADNNISVRRIPIETVSCYRLNPGDVDRHAAKGIKFEVFKGKRKQWCKDFKKFVYPETEFIRVFKYPENGGKWMTKIVNDSGSIVRWNIETDNLADTLEQSVKLCLGLD